MKKTLVVFVAVAFMIASCGCPKTTEIKSVSDSTKVDSLSIKKMDTVAKIDSSSKIIKK